MPCFSAKGCGEEALYKCEVVVCVHFLFLSRPPHLVLVLHVTLQRFDYQASRSCRTSLFALNSPQLGKHVFEMLL